MRVKDSGVTLVDAEGKVVRVIPHTVSVDRSGSVVKFAESVVIQEREVLSISFVYELGDE